MKESISMFRDFAERLAIALYERLEKLAKNNILERQSQSVRTVERKHKWFIPMKIVRDHQVINKKPLIINARNRL